MISTLLLVLLLLTHSSGKIYKRAKENGTPSNRLRTGRPPIFDDAEKQRLVDFVTRDARTRRLTWEAICLEMGYACSAHTVRNLMASMGYHKRIPTRKFNIRPYNKPLRWGRAGAQPARATAATTTSAATAVVTTAARSTRPAGRGLPARQGVTHPAGTHQERHTSPLPPDQGGAVSSTHHMCIWRRCVYVGVRSTPGLN